MTSKKEQEKTVDVVTGTFSFAVPVKDIEKLKKNPKSKLKNRYGQMFVDRLINIDLLRVVTKEKEE